MFFSDDDPIKKPKLSDEFLTELLTYFDELERKNVKIVQLTNEGTEQERGQIIYPEFLQRKFCLNTEESWDVYWYWIDLSIQGSPEL